VYGAEDTRWLEQPQCLSGQTWEDATQFPALSPYNDIEDHE
jgi:hypothetical protein